MNEQSENCLEKVENINVSVTSCQKLSYSKKDHLQEFPGDPVFGPGTSPIAQLKILKQNRK